ncbi:MAG: TonB-dependent receptor [Vicinamibacterales bacterium]
MNRLSIVAACWLAAVGLASGQGVQTGGLTGTVVDTQGLVVPGVTVTATSPALQGERVETTNAEGSFVIRGLPPGVYHVTFTLSGMSDVTLTVNVPLGGTAHANPTMTLGGVSEAVSVVGVVPEAQVVTTQVSTNIKKEDLDFLPQGRTPQAIAALAPNLNTNTPNAGQLQIAGAFAYDNVFLVDGVDVNDNLFGNANNLYIEDAIEETQVLTSGISAEYGRFSGGVINVVTKSGGNVFSGSFRENLTNAAWARKTPFQVRTAASITDKINPSYEGTFGGPIQRDRLWFFGAGRYVDSTEDRTLPESGAQYANKDRNKRGQIKLTGTVSSGHTLQGQYLNNTRTLQRVAFTTFPSLYTVDPAAVETPSFPNTQFVTTYRGAMTNRLFVEGQYSQKRFGFRDSGGTRTGIVDSPFLGLSSGAHYNAPYFDATDPEDRDNRQYAGSAQYLWAKPGVGVHDFKVGVERYTSIHTGGNSQSSTGYVFDADYLADAAGKPIYDSANRFIPIFTPGETLIEDWRAVRGATQHIATTSLYARDRWSPTSQLTLDIGVRFERVRSEATGDIVSVDTDTVVPRVGASYDVTGKGRFVLQGTYAHYAGKYSESQFGNNTSVGNPTGLFGVYLGPAGQGRNFAAGFDPRNYLILDGNFPLANVFFDKNLSSPITRELTLQAGGDIGRKGFAKVSFINRSMANFVEDFITLDTGSTTIVQDGEEFGTFSNRVFRNSDAPQRDYRALVFQSRYRFSPRWLLEGAYTLQLKGDGNFEGEAANQPGISSRIGDYPEIFNEARTYPVGRFDDYERHRLRVWSFYNLGLGRFGDVGVAGIWRVDSAQYYSLAATNQALSAVQRQLGARYATLPSSQTVFFGARGSEAFKGYGVVDLAINYDIPIVKSLRPWLKLELYNVANNEKLIKWNTTVRPDPASPLDSLGLRTGYLKGATFGTGTANSHYPAPREFRAAFGFRF